MVVLFGYLYFQDSSQVYHFIYLLQKSEIPILIL